MEDHRDVVTTWGKKKQFSILLQQFNSSKSNTSEGVHLFLIVCVFVHLRLRHECPPTLRDQCSQSVWPGSHREEGQDPPDHQRRVRGRVCHRWEEIRPRSHRRLFVLLIEEFTATLFIVLVCSARSSQPDAHGSKRPVRPLCQTQTDSGPQKPQQTED